MFLQGCVSNVTCADIRYPDHPDFFGTCFCLPAVKKLYGFNQGNEEEAEGTTSTFEELQLSSSSVEFIEPRLSKLKISNFALLLKAPKCLKIFMYKIGNTWALSAKSAVSAHADNSAVDRTEIIRDAESSGLPESES
jgi:hypothetical protein